MYYSPLGNKRFVLLPYKFGRQPLCKIYNNDYSKKFFYGMRNCSNYPIYDNSNIEFCDLLQLVSKFLVSNNFEFSFSFYQKQHYFIRNCSFDASILPAMTPTGRYRVVILCYKKGERNVTQGMEFRSIFT